MKKILIVGPAWVGDMIIAQSLFRLLKEQQPDTNLDVLAPPWTHALLTRMPEVSTALSLPISHGKLALVKRWRIGISLKKSNYTQAIVLPNAWKSALIPFFANIPLRTGWIGEARYGLLNDYRHLDKKKLPLMQQRFAALSLSANAELPTSLPQPTLITNPLIDRHSYHLITDKSILILCPGAEFGESKRWPATHFAEVARHYLARSWQILILGSINDQVIAENINQLTQNKCINQCGLTTLTEATDLIALATLVITNDSGLMHIAAALNKPLIALYGSTSANFTPPLTSNAKILQLSLDCQPCFQRKCPLQHHYCMQHLTPAMVLNASATCGF